MVENALHLRKTYFLLRFDEIDLLVLTDSPAAGLADYSRVTEGNG